MKTSLSLLICLILIFSLPLHAKNIVEKEERLTKDYQQALENNNTEKLNHTSQKIVMHCHNLYQHLGPYAGLGRSSVDQCIVRLQKGHNPSSNKKVQE